MLAAEPNTQYLVYPSWAELSYKWEDLPWLLSHPLESGYVDLSTDWRKFGYPETIAPCGLIDGPCGGGIVVTENVMKWMPGMVLTKEANWRTPDAMVRWLGTLPFHVGYLEPYDDPLLNALEGKPRTKIYVCSFTAEHIESDPDAQFWVVAYEKRKRTVAGLDELAEWAHHFGLEVKRLSNCPEHLRVETADWFRNPDREFVWYHVSDFKPLAGLCLAIVLYLGLHLRKVAGPRLKSMHMLAGIEGKPNMRKHWPRR